MAISLVLPETGVAKNLPAIQCWVAAMVTRPSAPQKNISRFSPTRCVYATSALLLDEHIFLHQRNAGMMGTGDKRHRAWPVEILAVTGMAFSIKAADSKSYFRKGIVLAGGAQS
jgi:hypothetical protein